MVGYANAVLAESASITAKTANKAGRNLVTTTPVDTAFARSNWVASIGAPDLSLRAIRGVNATVNEIKNITATVKYDQEIHISNGGEKVPYLKYLNAGSSFQAPANFVRLALMNARGVPQDARLLILRRT